MTCNPRASRSCAATRRDEPLCVYERVEFVRAIDGRPAPPDDLPADLPDNVARLPLAKTG
jgi:hypothetical protein